MTEKLLMQAENDIYRIVLRPDGIIHVHYKKGAKVTVDILKELAEIYTSMTKIDRPYIFTGDEFVSITNEARKYAAKMDRVIPLVGSVFVAQNLAQKILAQYYFKFNRPAKPLHVVSTFDKGIETIYQNYQLHPIEGN